MLLSVVVVDTWARRIPLNKNMAPTVTRILGITFDLFIETPSGRWTPDLAQPGIQHWIFVKRRLVQM
jgi:hypothetical protein